jgi:DNA replication protein DnaC
MQEISEILNRLTKNMPQSVKALSAEELMLQAAELSKQAAEKLADERRLAKQRRSESLMKRAAIPGRFASANLVPATAAQSEAYKSGIDFVENFKTRLITGAGMVFWGDIGTGKTHLACAIANTLAEKGVQVMYCTALEAVMLVKASWKRGDDGLTEYDVYERFGEPKLLIIDEIGVQNGTDFEKMVLTSIADIRSRNCYPTIIVSNLTPDQIYGILGERMFDRLVGFGADIVHFKGRSLRLRAAL